MGTGRFDGLQCALFGWAAIFRQKTNIVGSLVKKTEFYHASKACDFVFFSTRVWFQYARIFSIPTLAKHSVSDRGDSQMRGEGGETHHTPSPSASTLSTVSNPS